MTNMITRFMVQALFVVMGITAFSGLANAQFVQQPIVYQPFQQNQLGDGSTPSGGTPPYIASEPADIPSNFTVSDWTIDSPSFQENPPGSEAKLRILCNHAFFGVFDPVVFPGQDDAGHHHTFFGNTGVTKDSTYTSLRTTGDSTCTGGPVNRTAYWHTSVMVANAFGDGQARPKKADQYVAYYTNSPSEVASLTFLPRALNYVSGFDPDNPNNDRIKDAIDIAMNTSGRTQSYTYQDDGFTGWQCGTINGSNADSPDPGDTYQPWLVNANGTVTLDCPETEPLIINFEGAGCWDGVNPTSPDGRSHVAPLVRDNNNGGEVCPDGWYRLPTVIVRGVFSHGGVEDYKRWFFSADRHGREEINWYNPGTTGHFDWFGAWDYGTSASPGVMIEWMTQCMGITYPGITSTDRECNNSTFNTTTRLKVTENRPGESIPVIRTDLEFKDGYNGYGILPARGAEGDQTRHQVRGR